MHKIKKIGHGIRAIFTSKKEGWVLARICVLALIAALFHFLFLGGSLQPKLKLYYRFFRLLFTFLSILQFRHFYKKGTIVSGFKKAARKILHGIYKFVHKFELIRGRRQVPYLKTGGYEDTFQAAGKTVAKKKRRIWTKPWKSMDEKEKIRYLYSKKVLFWKKKGYQLKISDTPEEILDKVERGQQQELVQEKFIDAYTRVRYDKECEIDDEIRKVIQKRNQI